MEELAQRLRIIEDRLFPNGHFNVYQRVIYYNLLRRTAVDSHERCDVSLPSLARATGISESKCREVLRELEAMGALLTERSRTGFSIAIVDPINTGLLPEETLESEIDLESLDFFSGRRFVSEILDREEGRCFYCLRDVSSADLALDHVVAQSNGGDNGYRNVVAACHTCNSEKQSANPEDFFRTLYRSNRLSGKEFEFRLQTLTELQEGRIVPTMSTPT